MPFPRRFLHEGEEIILDRRPHLWFLTPSAVLLAIVAIGGAVLANVVNTDNVIDPTLTWAVLALSVLAALRFLWAFVSWRTTNFVVTTDRLIYRSGVVAKRGKEIPLERINDISFNQSVFERLIGAGDLLIESGGEQGQQRFSDINHPFDVQNEIYRQIERSQARDMDRMAGRRQLSVPEQIEKLDELRQKGVLSQAEFDAKKTQLLEQI